MPLPSQCSKCRAPFPESIERFGANFACKECGQILRFEDPAEAEALFPQPSVPVEDLEVDDEEIAGGDDQPLPPIDRLLSEGWQIFRGQMGLCVGAIAVVTLINLIAQSPELFWEYYMKARVADPAQRDMIGLGLKLYVLPRMAFSVWLSIGLTQFMLKIVRGQTAAIGDLFGGGPYFWRALLCTFIMGLAVFAGTLLCIVPGIIVALMYSQFMYILIDRDSPGMESLWQSAELTQGKKRDLFGLNVICIFINLFGLLSLGFGILLTSPFTSIVLAMAYNSITGQHSRESSAENDEEFE